jgi:hypothetical protein
MISRRMTSFGTETEARRFFVEKIVQQAQREGLSLSDDERQMLLWSESAADSVADPAMAQRLAAEISDADYESKIVEILKGSFDRDTAANPGAKEVWAAALALLRRGDHYILVMINEAVGRHLKPWWQIW